MQNQKYTGRKIKEEEKIPIYNKTNCSSRKKKKKKKKNRNLMGMKKNNCIGKG